MKKIIFCLFSEKIYILLNKSIFEPFWSLNRHTFPPKVINNSYQSIIREYAGFFRMVEKYVYWKVMKKSLALFAITKNPGMKQRLISEFIFHKKQSNLCRISCPFYILKMMLHFLIKNTYLYCTKNINLTWTHQEFMKLLNRYRNIKF